MLTENHPCWVSCCHPRGNSSRTNRVSPDPALKLTNATFSLSNILITGAHGGTDQGNPEGTKTVEYVSSDKTQTGGQGQAEEA